RCVRVMAARYSTSGQSPNDVATAAIEFCRDSKISLIAPEVTDLVRRDVLTKTLEGQFRDKAIRTVVEMRTGDCVHKAGLFDGVINPIDKP
ncbi:hypothetical protein, partial [Sphingorhabdus sp.]|uniref:hypothetical protein n=1 Tax=Sphingorhabdus sp. TaxID=1902408 RepID=UPI003BB0EAB7